MAGADHLLPNESVICGTIHHSKGGEDDEYVLIGDGHIAKYHKHEFEGITHLFRLIHANEITSVEFGYSPANNFFRYSTLLFLIIGGSLIFAHPFSNGIDVFWTGFTEIHCSNGDIYNATNFYENSSVSCTLTVYEEIFEVFSLLSVILFPPFILIMSRRINLNPGTEVKIEHNFGQMIFVEKVNSFLWPSIYYYSAVLFWLIFYPTGSGASWVINMWGVLVIFPLAILITVLKRTSPLDDEVDYPIVNMKKFSEKLSEFLDLDEKSDGAIRVIPISEKYALEMKDIKDKLSIHDEMLSRVGVKYSDSFGVPAPWLGVSALRTSTEILLDHRIKQMKPSDKNIRRDLQGHINTLNQIDDDFKNNIYLMVESLRTSGNEAVHRMTATKEDYISSLQKFREIVDWHFNHPPKINQ
jgi:hypothetical protein